MVSPWFAGAGVGERLSALQTGVVSWRSLGRRRLGRGPLVFESVPRAYRRGERPTSTIVCSSSVAGRWGAISSTLRSPHELRAAQVVIPHGEQVGFEAATLHVRRAKKRHVGRPLSGREMRELRRHQRESPSSPFVFVSERRA
jgi:hypothetical protein